MAKWETEDPSGIKPQQLKEHAPPEPEPTPRGKTLTELLEEHIADEDLIANIKLEFKRWLTSMDLSNATSEERARQFLVTMVDEP